MADNFSGWPTYVDDDGSLTFGTVPDAAMLDAIRGSIADNVYSAVNPAVKTKTTIDEVISARGTKASLDARLDISLNEDGTLKPTAVPRVIAAGYSGATGFGTFRTQNNAKLTVNIPANTLAADGDAIHILATGRQTAADTPGMGVSIGGTDFIASMSAGVQGMIMQAILSRISATQVLVLGGVTGNGATFLGTVTTIAVADLAANQLAVLIGVHSNAGSGTASILAGYSFIHVGAR